MLSCVAAVAIAAMVGKKTYESHVSDSLLLENVEALADAAGESTSVGTCYLQVSSGNSNTQDFKLFCNGDTDSDNIYPCPQTTSYGSYNAMATDRCTK